MDAQENSCNRRRAFVVSYHLYAGDSFSVAKNFAAGLENTWYFFQRRLISTSSLGMSGRKQRRLPAVRGGGFRCLFQAPELFLHAGVRAE